jgi:DNA-binding transcriptional LysR family regulator
MADGSKSTRAHHVRAVARAAGGDAISGSLPHVAVQLVLTDRETHFLDDQVDVALRIGDLRDSSLMATGLGTVWRVMCASPAYLTTRGIPETLEDLAGHSVISFDVVSTPRTWIFESGGAEVTAAFTARLSVNTIDAAIDAGLAGTGLVRAVSYQVADFVRAFIDFVVPRLRERLVQVTL